MSKDELKIEKKSEKKSEKTSKSSTKDTKKQPNKVAKYFKDLRSEFKKVVWPTKKQIFNNTGVVLVTITILGLFVGGLDVVLLKFLQIILNR